VYDMVPKGQGQKNEFPDPILQGQGLVMPC